MKLALYTHRNICNYKADTFHEFRAFKFNCEDTKVFLEIFASDVTRLSWRCQFKRILVIFVSY